MKTHRRRSHSLGVLLVSLDPDAHVPVLDSFRRIGARVHVARNTPALLAHLRHAPDLVLVDLAFGAALTPTTVSALNSGRGPWVVVALHQGEIDRVGSAASELEVDGYCRASDLAQAFQKSQSAAFAASPLAN